MPKGIYNNSYKVECRVCQKKIMTQRRKTKFCSNLCRNIDWRKNNKERDYLNKLNWVHKNPDQHHINQYEYKKKRMQSDLLFKLKTRIRSRLGRIRIVKGKRTIEWLGCSMAELKKHLESKFTPGMTWENYGEWHIDHIVPLSKSRELNISLTQLCHYSNLQPLWRVDNLRKLDKLTVELSYNKLQE